MLKVLGYIKKREWLFVCLAIVTVVIQVWLNLKLPDYMSEVTTLVEKSGSKMSDILVQGGWMLLCAIGSAIAAIFTGYFAAKVAAGLARTLRSEMYKKTVEMSMENVDKFSTASLVNRTTNDITQVQNLIAMGLSAILMAPIMAVWALVKIWGKSWEWTALTGGAVLALLVFMIVTLTIAIPRFRKIQSLTDVINRIMREHLTGIRVVRAYNAEKYQDDKFKKANDDLTSNNMVSFKTLSFMNPVMQFANSGLSIGIYWIGSYLIADAGMGRKITLFSDMVVFSNYAISILMAFMLLGMIFFIWPRASVSAQRIAQVLKTEDKLKDGQGAVDATNDGTIEFQDVSFTYPGNGDAALKHVSFKAKSGQTIAFIGATGSGKTSLLNLIPRFYDATEGKVLVDGVDVRKYNRHDLRSRIGYATQKAILLKGTIKSNVKFGDSKQEITDKDVHEALAIAQATEFVDKLEKKENSPISQGGTNVSGGQKQRISIARAIARKPEILIFDDSFSALDYETDRNLRTTLNHKVKNATKLIVGQRIGTIKDADEIIVLENGEVVGKGKHEDLLKTCKTYQDIAESQLSKEELANG